ncbi:predicted protein [Naegleria gruberi]|uniref:Predicted protein n=1 Tax=Naegleria gruberi TaxID=5762 RepID=D2VYJ4_NAEGR|nr:uncharacterized protein NAEGRDRAFT_82802 [Naegleria gruberi]EFC38069.1 predicted protein [Naegleria gruberi]|eukprot:XP_002670813.1 predicted protein [Naegleria gruberi strain NEG-M]
MESVDALEKINSKLIPKYLNIVTFNVWFAPLMMKERMEGIMQMLMAREELPDVMCFQEVTDEALEFIASHELIRKEYYLSDSPNDYYTTVDPYGVLMAVRKGLPVRRMFYNTLPSRMYRACLSVELNDGKESFCISTVHLESLASTDMRFKQLDVISEFQQAFDNAVLCGDFNFDSERNYDEDYLPYLENDYLNNENWKSYTDIWKELKYPSNELGKTFDTSVNTMLKGQKEELMRYDRVMLKSKSWKPTFVELLGTSPIQTNPDIFLSDHFGICTRIEKSD